MKIKEYPKTTSLADTDALVVETSDGTKYIEGQDLTSWKKIYPVGAVYISYNSTSPASLFGGSWTQITGAFIRAATDVNTGGSDSIDHQHYQTLGMDENSGKITMVPWTKLTNKSISGIAGLPNTQTFTSNGTGTMTIDRQRFTPSDSAFSNATSRFDATSRATLSTMPAYQDLYVWRRTA